MDVRVLLIYANPNQSVPVSPYGLEIVRGQIAATGTAAEVRIINPFLEDLDAPRRTREALEEFQPELIGLSLRNIDNAVVAVRPEAPASGAPVDIISYLPAVAEVVAEIKAWDPDVPCVMGGAAFSSCPAECLSYFGLEMGFVGPAEDSFRRLVELMAPRRDTVIDLIGRLPGSVVRVPGGGFRQNHRAPQLAVEAAYTAAIAPEYTQLYRLRGIPAAVRTKSGCPMRCTYCIDPINLRITDKRPIAHVLDDIEMYVHEYGLTTLHIADAELNLPDERHVLDLCQGIVDRNLADRTVWHGYFNATPCSDELITAMIDAGCRTPSFAIDSFTPAGLRGHRKSFRLRHVHDLLGRLLAAGAGRLHPQICVLLGQPGETLADVDENLRWMVHYADRGASVAYSCGLRVYPHTPLAGQALDDRHHYRANGSASTPARDPFSLLEPLVYCEPLAPRELAAYVASRVGGHPRISVFAEWPWPEATHGAALRRFNVGVHRLSYGRIGEATELFDAALELAPDLHVARRVAAAVAAA